MRIAGLSNLKVQGKLIFAMVAAGVLPLTLSGILNYREAREGLVDGATDKLHALAETKRQSIEEYFSLIENQAITLAEDPAIIDGLRDLSESFDTLAADEAATAPAATELKAAVEGQFSGVFGAEYAKQTGKQPDTASYTLEHSAAALAQYHYIVRNPHPLGQKNKLDKVAGEARYHALHARYHTMLNAYLERFGYYDVFLIDLDGDVVYSVFKEMDYATNLKTGPWRDSGLGRVFRSALESNDTKSTFFDDFAPYTPSYEAPASFIAVPVFDGATKVGVLAMQMPVGRINAVMQESEGMGKSGETYLVGADKLMRSQSRLSDKPTLLVQKIDSEAARNALAGQAGSGIYQDYRGVDVLGAYEPMDVYGTKWALIAEVDADEALVEVTHLTRIMVIVGVLSTLLVAALAFLFGRAMAGRIKAGVTVAERIAQGNFDNAIKVEGTDEITELMQALETMQGELFGRIMREKNEALRINLALDVSTANVMIADNDFNIIYTNQSVQKMLGAIESELRQELPQFSAGKVLGGNIDIFHKNPAHQRKMLQGMSGQHTANITVGGREMKFTAVPVLNERGERLGTVVEWWDMTDQRRAERQIAGLIEAASNGKLDSRLDAKSLGEGFLPQLAAGINQMLDAIVLPINVTADTLKSIAEGRIPAPLTAEFKGDFVAIKDNLDTCSSVLRALLEDTSKLAVAATAGQLSERADLERHWGDFRRIVEGMNNTLDAIVGPITEVRSVVSELASGNLQKEVSQDFSGEFAVLSDAVNSSLSNLRDMVHKIRGAAVSIGTSAGEIAKGNQDLSARTEEQASSLEETAASMEELTGTVKQNADNAKQANQLAASAREEAEKGGSVVANAVSAMDQINDSSKKIADIIGVIDEIAFQTNLLALNAAVEAARAGEHGRGFAVVASEVRNLAQRSAVAAKEIKVLIKDSVSKVEDGARLVNESGSTLATIVSSVKKVSDIVGEIAAASAEQSAGIEQVNKAIMQMEQVTQQNAALVEESAAASESMDEESRSLNSLIGFFKVGGPEVQQSSTHGAPPRVERRSAERPWSKPARADSAPVVSMSRAATGGGDDEVWDEF